MEIYLKIPEICPYCGTKLIIEENNNTKILICPNNNCEMRLINRLDHFCGKKGLDIKGLSKATLEKLIDWGWINNLSDIFELKQHRAEWVTKAGFGVKSVDNILNAIEAAKNPSLDSFISSLGIPFIGKTVSKELVKQIHSYEEFRDKAQSRFDFSSYDGFAGSKTSAIWNYNFSEADKVYQYLTVPVVEEKASVNPASLNGITVVITGKLTMYKNRAALQADIEAAGGKVVGSVSKNTNYLIIIVYLSINYWSFIFLWYWSRRSFWCINILSNYYIFFISTSICALIYYSLTSVLPTY